jgi:general secretion pathway protein H
MNKRAAVLRGEDGFTLLEMACVLAVVALLAALVLPRVPRGTSLPRLEAYAIEAAAILKADRTAAMKVGRQIATRIDARSRTIRSGVDGRAVQVANDVVVTAFLPERCNDRPALSTVSFFPSGMSCGGSIAFLRGDRGYEIHVNWLTGGVDIVARGQS